MSSSITITLGEAAALLQIGAATLRDRALRQKRIRVHRHSPLQFRLNDILESATELRRKSPRGRKPSAAHLGRFA